MYEVTSRSASDINNQNGKKRLKKVQFPQCLTAVCGDSQTHLWKVNCGSKFHNNPGEEIRFLFSEIECLWNGKRPSRPKVSQDTV
jgi:hypothetical protein